MTRVHAWLGQAITDGLATVRQCLGDATLWIDIPRVGIMLLHIYAYEVNCIMQSVADKIHSLFSTHYSKIGLKPHPVFVLMNALVGCCDYIIFGPLVLPVAGYRRNRWLRLCGE